MSKYFLTFFLLCAEAIGQVSFDGVNDYAEFPDSDYYSGMTGATFCTWIYLDRTNTGGSGYFTHYSNIGNQRSIRYFAYSNTLVYCQIGDATGSTWTDVVGRQHMQYNKWTHFASVFSSGNMAMYIDGVGITTTTSGTIPATLFNSTDPVYVGRRHDGLYLSATLQDLRFYRRALLAREISEIARPERAFDLSNDANLVLRTCLGGDTGAAITGPTRSYGLAPNGGYSNSVIVVPGKIMAIPPMEEDNQ
jgi:hypothetical protein